MHRVKTIMTMSYDRYRVIDEEEIVQRATLTWKISITVLLLLLLLLLL
jgi:uncharacterized integral membrane protein